MMCKNGKTKTNRKRYSFFCVFAQSNKIYLKKYDKMIFWPKKKHNEIWRQTKQYNIIIEQKIIRKTLAYILFDNLSIFIVSFVFKYGLNSLIHRSSRVSKCFYDSGCISTNKSCVRYIIQNKRFIKTNNHQSLVAAGVINKDKQLVDSFND